jgi:Protein of unknown function (DUF2723)/Tetratricopeptide repeat
VNEWIRRPTVLVGSLVFLITVAVYPVTMFPTVPFWDAGEYIASSYILGVPHPPGTPFYVLLGRIATLVPLGNIAQRVNALSAIPAALAVLLTYLTALKLIRIAQGGSMEESRKAPDEWIAHLGAATCALLLAFSDSFWENAIEAEVYALMSFAQILVLYLGLRWWEEHEQKPTAGPVLLAVYIMWLCVGLHLGVGIIGLPLFLLVLLVDRRAALVFAMPLLSVLIVTSGLERVAGVIMILSSVTMIALASRGKLNPVLAWACGLIAAWMSFTVAFADRPFTPGSAFVALASVLVPMTLMAFRTREGRILALSLMLMAAGYSTHIYLPIRAAQHPAVNEGDPSNWDRLSFLLERKQYGNTGFGTIFNRRGTPASQLDKEFWRYFRRQWPLFDSSRLEQGIQRQGGPGPIGFVIRWVGGIPFGALLPLLLGVVGAVWQLKREKKSALYTGSFVGLSTVAMILYLNFSDGEVRERDYFFQSGYHAYALWIGLGIARTMGWLRESFEPGSQRKWLTVAAAALFAAQPFALLANLWYTHDRRGNYVARDYAYNMLAPLAPNSYVVTNGDNDTFPLWYIQEVEGFRKDVRVVNLSLLNTGWYIRQLRDQEPKLPIVLNDAAVDILNGGAVQDSTGRIIYTNQFMVGHIVEQSRKGGGWSKQPYFAVTVPEHMGLDDHFTLEGLVYKVQPEPTTLALDVDVTRKALYEEFRYRGLFHTDGSWDPSVYKDENAATLSRNYAAAHIQLAFHYRRTGDLRAAIAEMERVGRMFPDYVDVQVPLGGFYMEAGDTVRAIELFRSLAAQAPGDPEVRYYRGVTLLFQDSLAAGIQELDAAITLDPNFVQPYYAAYVTLSQAGERDRGLRYLERWLALHPDDAQVRALLETERPSTGAGPRRGTMLPPPPPLQLP